MACRTPSVERVADKTISAKAQLEKLTDEITAQKDKHLSKFKASVIEHLKDAKITDQREIDANDYIKTEYSSEFSLDKIASVVKQSLKTIAKVKNSEIPNSAFSDEAVESYTDLVNSVSEASKSSSSSSASLTFSMNRLCPGLFAFLATSSVSMKEEETFGNESITSTIIFYRVIESIQDIKSETKFVATRIDSENLLKLKTVQAQLTDSLSQGKISIDEWLKRDESLSVAIERVDKRLQANSFSSRSAVADLQLLGKAPENQRLVSSAIEKLSAMGEEYAAVVEKSQMRLKNSYY